VYNQHQFSLAYQTVSGAPGWSSVNSLLSGFDGGIRLKITGLSGEPTVTSATVGRAIFARHVNCSNGQLVHRTVWCAPDTQCPVRQSAQRSNGRICQIWKEIPHRTVYKTCSVAHRIVRCATRQKARIAFLVGLQRLLAALGL
jgi:hypothetical protein